ncbi:MAG: hypothetical protein GKR90_09630 [Pseudomonadales bacterium]|nr:hypothetical protein [Pseudomonadales bacterium]
MAILLLFSAYLQLNDPDGWLWFAIYGLGGLMMLISLKRSLPAWAYLGVGVGVGVGSLGFALWIAFAVEAVQWREVFASMRMDAQGVEEVREVAGLAIQGIWFCFFAWYEAARKSA